MNTAAQPLDMARLAHEVRRAFLIVDAAIPLGEVAPEPLISHGGGFEIETAAEPGAILTVTQAGDLSQLRAIAFVRVLRELIRYDYVIYPGDAQALEEGRMPSEPSQDTPS